MARVEILSHGVHVTAEASPEAAADTDQLLVDLRGAVEHAHHALINRTPRQRPTEAVRHQALFLGVTGVEGQLTKPTVRGRAISDGEFVVAIHTAHERAHAVNLLSERLRDEPDTRAEDLEIFAHYAEGRIDFATFKVRLKTGEG